MSDSRGPRRASGFHLPAVRNKAMLNPQKAALHGTIRNPENKKGGQDLSNSTVGREFVLHIVNPGIIPNIPCLPEHCQD